MQRETRGVQLGTVTAFVACLALMLQTSLSAHEKGQSKHWTALREAAERRNPVARTHDSIGRGRTLFRVHCSSCHGEQGRGDGVAVSGLRQKPPDLGKMAYHHPDGDLAWKIAEGRGAMPGWRETLSDEDIWDLVNFIRSLGR